MPQITIHLPKPHVNQQAILDSKAKYKVVLAGRQFGKSLLCLIVAIQKMLEGKRVAYITPTFNPLGKEFFDELINYLPELLIKKSNAAGFSIELITGGSIRFFSGESLSRFRGITKISLVIIDEAAHIPSLKSEFGTSILPTLLKANGDIIAISTPCGREMFYSLYEKGLNGVENWESFHFTTYDNPTLTSEAIENLKSLLTEFEYEQEMLAVPGADGDNPFGTGHIANNTIQELSSKPPVVFGIDLAKYHDYTVITGLDEDGCTCYFDRFRLPWVLTQAKIEQLPADILKVVDSTGVGDVIFEGLQLTCSNIIGFKFTAESKPKLIFELVRDIEAGKLKFNQLTANEMQVFEIKYTSTGHITFNAKAGFNDDAIISLALANHHRNQALAYKNWELYSA